MPGSAEYFDLMTHLRMERVVDTNQLYELFAGSM